MALNKVEITAKLQLPEWKALLDTIAFCEGGKYNIIYSGVPFNDYSDHPNRVIKGASAAGRYQIINLTWFGTAGRPGLKQSIPLPNFTPNSQDIAAVWLAVNSRGVDPALVEQDAPNFSNFDRITSKLSCEWCALPGTSRCECKGQPQKSLQTAYNFYVQALNWRRGLGPEPTGANAEGEGAGDTGPLAGFTNNPLTNGIGSLFAGISNISEEYCALIKPLTYVEAKSFPGCDKRIELNFFGGPNGVGAAANPLIGQTNVTNPTIPSFINIDPNSIKYGEFVLPIEKFTFTSGVGPRWGRIHNGVDLAAPTGTPSASIADGIVEVARWTTGGYGNLVIIKHTNGYYSLNGHFSKLLVNEGQQVKQGQVIALVGSTGFSTGPHLHLEIGKTRNGNTIGNRINPATVLNLSKR